MSSIPTGIKIQSIPQRNLRITKRKTPCHYVQRQRVRVKATLRRKPLTINLGRSMICFYEYFAPEQLEMVSAMRKAITALELHKRCAASRQFKLLLSRMQ